MVEGPSWFQLLVLFSMVSDADCIKRSSFSESIAQGRADTFSLYVVMNCCFVMVFCLRIFPVLASREERPEAGKTARQ